MTLKERMMIEIPGPDGQMPANARSQLRIPVSIEGGIANSAMGRRPATLVDLSSQGCRIDWPFGAAVDTLVVLTIPGLAPIGARIRWTNATHIGLAFNTPLHPSVLDQIVGTRQS